MKKIIFLFLLLLVITGCSNDVADNTEDQDLNIDDIDNEIDDMDNLFDYGLGDIEDDLDSI
tara:strand:+ start:661 stop:843 length:183 start_codon:yes stop_codon:yes gene_type:complete